MANASPVPSSGARGSSDLFLFMLASVIWGTTWLAIKFQLGAVEPEVSVAWRFGLASLLLIAWCFVRRIPLSFSVRDHIRLALLGFSLFGINYVLVYYSEQHLASGLVAVLFSFLVFWNLIGARIFFGTPAPRAVIAGAILGVAGVALLFWPEVVSVRGDAQQGWWIAVVLLATLVSASANLYSQRIFATVSVVPGTGVAMAYASAAVLAYCVVIGVPITFDPRPAYVLSLLYLSIFGSVIAFVAFLTLLRRIGAGRSGYTAAVIPVIAMTASTIFENYQWTPSAMIGLVLVLAGTIFVLRIKEKTV